MQILKSQGMRCLLAVRIALLIGYEQDVQHQVYIRNYGGLQFVLWPELRFAEHKKTFWWKKRQA